MLCTFPTHTTHTKHTQCVSMTKTNQSSQLNEWVGVTGSVEGGCAHIVKGK